MEQEALQEQVLTAWIGLNALLKDSRMTREMTYNEAVIMKLLLDQYRSDGVGRIPVQHILRQTNMLKSLANRTINALSAHGYLVKERGGEDARALFVRPVAERLPDFLAVHRHSLQLVQQIIDIIGESDAHAFVRICQKLADAAPKINAVEGEF